MGATAYVADRFGDVLKIDLGEKKVCLVMGNMCYNTSMCILSDSIVTADKYGRVRVSELTGKIRKYIFSEELPVTSVVEFCGVAVACGKSIVFFDTNLCFVQKQYLNIGLIRKLAVVDKKKLLVCGERTLLIADGAVEADIPFSDDAIGYMSDIARIESGKLLLRDKVVCELIEDNHEDFMKNITWS